MRPDAGTGLSKRSSYVKFTDEMEERLSPQRHIDGITVPLVIAYGTQETPEFQRQAAEFSTVLAGMGLLKGRFVLAGKNHFEVPETLNVADNELSKAVLAMMKG